MQNITIDQSKKDIEKISQCFPIAIDNALWVNVGEGDAEGIC